MSSNSPLVLHVDDDGDILAITKIALEAVGGLETIQCLSGVQAVEIAQRSNPDLLLLDLMMPNIDGVETLRLLRRIPGFADKPAIFMTGRATAENREELIQSGARFIITKPFDPISLASNILSVWRDAFQEQVKTNHFL